MKKSLRSLFTAFAAVALLFAGAPSAAAPPVKVSAATPSSGEQGTLDLDVAIDGSGFEPGAAVDFLVTGSSTDKGNVVVKSVAYNSSTKLTAKVSLQNAKIADFDVKVTLMSGRNGKGISLFKVLAKQSGDTTPPAAVNPTVSPAILAATLRFTAPGDDGMSGTATSYDVRYVVSAGSCPSDPDSNWSVASASGLKPAAGGSADTFVVRPLDSGTSYCIAIRALDEVSNASAWTLRYVATLPGDWAIAEPPVPSSTTPAASATQVNLAFDGSVPAQRLMAWFAGSELNLVGTGSPVVLPVTGDQVRSAGSPSGGFGLVVYGASAPITYIDDTGAAPEAQTVAASSVLDADQFSSVAFVKDQATNGWNPMVDYSRLEPKQGKGKKASLVVAERRGPTTWVTTPVLTQDTTYNGGAGILIWPELFAGPDSNGNPGVPRFAIAYCGVVVYAQRDATDPNKWTYYDAGPSLNFRKMAGTVDSTGQAVIVAGHYESTNGVDLVIGTQRNFKLFGGNGAMPPTSCSQVAASSAPAWPHVNNAAPDPNLNDPALSSQYVSGVAAINGAVFISASARANETEQRLIYRCAGDTAWTLEKIDRTYYVAHSAPPLDPNGREVALYPWNVEVDFAASTRPDGNACGVTP